MVQTNQASQRVFETFVTHEGGQAAPQTALT